MKFLILSAVMLLSTGLFAQSVPKLGKENETMNLYPNPAFGDVVHILTPTTGIKNVVVYDVFGKIVLKDRVTTALGVEKLPPGVYLLQVQQGKSKMTRKLIIK